jgi:microcystin-dependent protein
VVDHVFPQQGDPNDAENFAAWLGRKDLSDYVEFGFTITPDFANNEFSISDGKAHIFYAGTRQASNFGSPEDRINLSYYGYLESRSGISLPNTSGLNNIYVELNLDTDDNPEIVVNDDTTTAYSSESALQIAQVDTGSTSVTELNRVPGYGVPSGAITMWSGSINDIPAGWTLCDGVGGGQSTTVPDLQGKFVVGAGDSYSIGDTGGEDQVALSTAELPSHDHGDGNLDTGYESGHDHGSGTLDTGYQGGHDHGNGNLSTDTDGKHDHGVGGQYSHVHDSGSLGGGGHSHGYDDDRQNASSTTGATSGNDVSVYDDAETKTTTTDTSTVSISGNTGTTSIAISEDDAGNHSHNISGTTSNAGGHSHTVGGSTSNAGGHSHGVSGSTSYTGSGNSHENRPNYYSIAYIIKL